MSEAGFQKQVLSRLEHLEKDIGQIMEYVHDSKLDEDDKRALAEALKEEKEGKLLSKKQVFG